MHPRFLFQAVTDVFSFIISSVLAFALPLPSPNNGEDSFIIVEYSTKEMQSEKQLSRGTLHIYKI